MALCICSSIACPVFPYRAACTWAMMDSATSAGVSPQVQTNRGMNLTERFFGIAQSAQPFEQCLNFRLSAQHPHITGLLTQNCFQNIHIGFVGESGV